MKKYILVLLVSLLINSLQSQTAYYKLLDKDTTTWQHFNCVTPVVYKGMNNSFSAFDLPLAAIDSITINSNRYKKIYELSTYSVSYTTKTLIGYMREDTIAKKVYFRETTTSTEYLLYDFSLNVNDSIFLTFPQNSFYNGYYRADSIVIKNERCGPRKHFYMRKHLNNPQPTLYYVEYIESIGSTLHALYPYASWAIASGCQFSGMSSSCKHQWSLGLSCKCLVLK